MVKIIKVKAKGFASIVKKIKYKFDRPGLNIITGENGAGKSTIISLVRYCWFGQTLKPGSSIEPWPSLNHQDGTFVETTLRVDGHLYKVIRCHKYKGKIDGKKGGSQLLVFKDGQLMQLKGKVETQKFINGLIGYSDILFKAAVIFGQETLRLMEEDGPTKKKILEEAFEASYITKAKDIVEKRIAEKLTQQVLVEQEVKIKKITYKTSKENYERQKQLEESFEDDKNREIKGIKKEIRLLKEEKAKKEEKVAKLPSIEKRIAMTQRRVEEYKPDESVINEEFKANMKMLGLGEKVDQFKAELKALQIAMFSKETRCSKCRQKIDKKKVRAIIQQDINLKRQELKTANLLWSHAQKEWKAAKKKVSSLETDKKIFRSIQDEKKRLEDILSNLKDTQRDLINVDREIKRLNKDITRVKKRTLSSGLMDSEFIKKAVKRNKKKLRIAQSNLEKINKKVRIDRWLLKDPLSNSGLKAYIFDTMLKKLNNQLIKYGNYIGFSIEVGIDMGSARKDVEITITKGENLVPYADLSKGQKQLANVALIFAIHDTVTLSKPINILVLDEIFESLSKENVEKVGNLIQMMAKRKSIHLITHLSDFQPVNAYRTQIYLNEQGHTTLAQKYRDS